MLALAVGCTSSSEEASDSEDDDGDDDDDASPNIEWEVDLGEDISEPLIDADGTLVVVTDEGTVVALDPDDGREQWSGEIDLQGRLTWAIDRGSIRRKWLLLPDGGGGSAFSLATGEALYGYYESGTWDEIRFTSTDDAFAMSYMGLWYGYAVLCDKTDCRPHAMEDAFTTASGIDGGELVTGIGQDIVQTEATPDPEVTFSDVDWATRINFDPAHGPLVHDDYIVLTSEDGEVLALDRNDGSEVWSFEADTRMEGAATVDEDEGLVFVAGNDGVVYALTLRGGAERWTYTARDAVFGGVTVNGDTVYVASADGTLAALDIDDGGQRWSIDLDDELRVAPVVIAGLVIVADENGDVYAIREP
jgi:outer membrane protein assembly factor BamB